MLTITETAAQAINSLVTANEMPEGAGLRIAGQQEDQPEALELSVAATPSEQDSVLEGGGAKVFLEPVAAQVLDDKVLDVQRVTEEGEEQLRFAIAPQS
ncbi:MAG: adhesin [Pseudonocardiaceae bacterium]|nr:adhesin [Pseudonocardiaceae bacterium]